MQPARHRGRTLIKPGSGLRPGPVIHKHRSKRRSEVRLRRRASSSQPWRPAGPNVVFRRHYLLMVGTEDDGRHKGLWVTQRRDPDGKHRGLWETQGIVGGRAWWELHGAEHLLWAQGHRNE